MENISGTAWKIIAGLLVALFLGYQLGKNSKESPVKFKTDPLPEKETVAATTEKVEAETDKEKNESPKN